MFHLCGEVRLAMVKEVEKTICQNVIIVTALFINTQILKFKSQLMFAFFTAVLSSWQSS